jgi:uncharacterized protein
MRSRIVRRVLVVLGLPVIVLNVAAFGHARALSRFSEGGTRTPLPEALSLRQKLHVLLTGANVPRPTNRRTPADAGLAFERHVFPGAHGLPIEAWYIPQADSRGTVVLFHGHADSKISLMGPARTFQALGFETMLVDFYGSGGSGGHDTSVGFYEAEDVVAAYEQAAGRGPTRPVVLYGVSMGAAAILKAVSDRQLRPSALILECPFDSLLTTVRHRFTARGLPAFPAADLLVFWGGVQQGYNALAFRPYECARGVVSPTLLMNGDADPWVTLDEARTIFDRLGGPKELHVFHGLGHQSFQRARPEDWTRAISVFLATRLGSRRWDRFANRPSWPAADQSVSRGTDW